jgi:predicted ATPase/DNA-binding SARP family transcriptional activator/DNA-binding CsgD family transcriptional regulator/Flp pilus assembly protein TadD
MRPPAGLGHEASRVRSSEVVRVWLLGGFRISIGSRTIEGNAWRLKKAAALVKLLALAPGHRLHREQAMSILWPDSGRKAASNSLRSTLHAARNVLDPAAGANYLASEEESLVLCPEGDLWVDVDAFEQAAATARGAKEPAAYRAALDLYGSDLLPEDRYEQWTEGRRNELQQLYFVLLVELAGLYEERYERELAIEELRKATAKEPILEEAHLNLMRLHALSGRPERALAQYERLREALYRELGTDPTAAARRLRNEIAAGNLLPTLHAGAPREEELPGTGRHNLPTPRTSFVGREREMLEVKRELVMTRLLTLTGAGGLGKTRLALELAQDLVGVYSDGVWFVELATLTEGALVPQLVAKVLGVQEQPNRRPTDTLVDALKTKEMLLVLDNCEHLVEICARLVDALLAGCPRLKVLATSRETLRVAGEAVWVVSSLSIPHTDRLPETGELTRYEAVRLFVDRARLRVPDFDLTPANGRAVVEICGRLEGIPLAIELATARMGALAVDEVTKRLEDSLDLLSAGPRTVGPRQRTIRGTLEWSHGLLSESEQELFRRLSVFAGGWRTLEAAEAVGSDGIEKREVLDLLSRLVDKSLVVVEGAQDGSVRYRMLEPIRQYARERLEESGEAETIHRRHAEFFLALAEEAELKLNGPLQVEWLDRLEIEHDNLRASLTWALGRGLDLGPRMAVALCLFWYTRSYLSEGRTYLETVASNDTVPATVRARVLGGLGWIAEPQGDYERARVAYEESLELYRRSNDKRGVANALGDLGSLALDRGDYEQATSLLEESLAFHRELGSREDIIGILDGLGVLASARGDREHSISFFSEALALSRATGNVRRTAASLGNLGITMLVDGDPEQATVLLEESLALFRDLGSSSNIAIGLMYSALAALTKGDHGRVQKLGVESLKFLQKAQDKQHIADCLEIMAGAAGAQGSAKRAARLWGAAAALREEIGVPLQPEVRKLLDPYLERARSSLGELAWQATLAEGRAMMPKQAIEYSLSVEEPALPSPATHRLGRGSAVLTPRKEEVAVLVSRGLTNRQIASELSISEHTVATHITKILKRLGLNSRSRLSAWVAERGSSPPEYSDSRRN